MALSATGSRDLPNTKLLTKKTLEIQSVKKNK
jgi:hypothetical protein